MSGSTIAKQTNLMPVVTRPQTIDEVPSHVSESFLKNVSDSHLDKLYDLPEDIQDVMGLQALRPSAAVCKVMTIPNSNCVKIVTPDEHVSTGFHEILVYDMGQVEWPQVPLCDIGCLRLDWPKDLFAFVGRYQLELEQMRKVCRDRFGPAAAGTCLTCDKYIQVNLGKHVALYHLDLAQLWRCPVAWCPVWKGISQDCVDHMRRAHNTPLSVKAGNLARWFPPWTVTREQWHSMSRPSVSGIAIDTFLFSRIGMLLFHRYRVFDRLGGHPAFRGPYMSRLFAFLKEADAASIRRSHRRRAKEIAASMSKRTSSIKEVPAATSSSRRSVQCTPVSKITGRESGPSLVPPAGSRPQVLTSSIYRQSAEQDTVQALMDLSLPRFTKLDDGVIPKTKPWPVTENPPASRQRNRNRTRTPSPCMDLDDISTDSSVGDTSPQNFKVTLLYDSEDSDTPVGSIVFSSNEDVLLSSGQEDRCKVRKHDSRPVSRPGPTDGPASERTPEPTPTEQPVEIKTDPLVDKLPAAVLPEGSDIEVRPLIIIEHSSVEVKPMTTDGLLPIGSEILLPGSPEVTVFEDQDALSCPLSPNRVREGHSQDMPAEGSIFDVSPDLPGFNMRPAGAVCSSLKLSSPRRQTTSVSTIRSSGHQFHSLNVTIHRGRIPQRQCQYITYRRTVTLVLISRRCRQCSLREFHRTVFHGRPLKISYGTLSGKALLISGAMPGCPYRMTSYTGTALVDADTTYGLQLHHPRFLEFIGAPDSARLLSHSPSFWVN